MALGWWQNKFKIELAQQLENFINKTYYKFYNSFFLLQEKPVKQSFTGFSFKTLY